MMIEVTVLVPQCQNDPYVGYGGGQNPLVQTEQWKAFLVQAFPEFHRGQTVEGRWRLKYETMVPYTFLVQPEEVEETAIYVADKVKEIFGEEKVYIRYGTAGIL